MFDAHLAFRARQQPRALAVVTDRRRVTYAQFDADVNRFAAGLLDFGVRPGRVAALRLRSGYLQLLALMATGRIGVATAPGTDQAADYAISDMPEVMAPAVPPFETVRLSREWVAAMFAAEPRPIPRPDIDPDALGRVMLSSGTTRKPRRVGLSWRRIEAGLQAAISVYAAGRVGVWIPMTGFESMLGHSQTLAGFAVGATVTNGLSVREVAAGLEQYAPGLISMTPVQLRQVLQALPADAAPCPGWLVITAGSVLPVAVAREARMRIGPDVRIIYGATEAGLSATGWAALLDETPNLLGYVPPGAEAEVVDDEGHPVPDGQPGELRVRGERTASGYLDDPVATAERFRGGWFYTRDLVRRLPDGRLLMDGRVDDRMNLGGTKFMPQVLETAALECAGVVDCAALAVPDGHGLDQAWLAVCAEPGFDRESLVAHLAGKRDLPPPRLAWIDEIPRNAMGKVERDRLRDAILAALDRG